jgi:hypothetical protein
MATISVLDGSGNPQTVNTLPAAGQTTMSASLPVAIASDQAAVPVSAASLPLPSGAATSAKQDTLLTAVQAATPAGESHIGAVGGNSVVVGGSFNRPADTTAYAIGDLVANSTTAGSVTPISAAAARVTAGTGVIRRIRLSTNKTSLAGTEQFRVHLFKASPTVANGDNGAFSTNGVASIALGYTDIMLTHVYNDGSKGFTATDIVFDAAGGSQNIYALIEARSAYTPASGETWTLALEVLQD